MANSSKSTPAAPVLDPFQVATPPVAPTTNGKLIWSSFSNYSLCSVSRKDIRKDVAGFTVLIFKLRSVFHSVRTSINDWMELGKNRDNHSILPFIWTKKGVIIDGEIWIIETYYSSLKSHMAVQICTVSYVEYFANSEQIIFGGALRSNKLLLYESKNRDFRSRKLEEKGGDMMFLIKGEGGDLWMRG